MTTPLKLGELFAGYGGLGMAVEEVFGAELAWYAEFETAPSKIMAHHWPNVPNYGDVTQIDWANIEPVDIISGGSPCQDLSLAGKRRGMNEGTRSNLWESMREGIATIKPKYVVWENVRGALSAGAVSEMEQSEGRLGESGSPYLRALGRVLGDLADLGYDAEWRGLRAADVGATHNRFRVFLLAALPDARGLGLEAGRLPSGQAPQVTEPTDDLSLFSDAYRLGYERGWEARGRRLGPANLDSAPANPVSLGCDGRSRAQGRQEGAGTPTQGPSEGTRWGKYEPAVRRWERIHGPAPRPTEPSGRNGKRRLSPEFESWMMGLPPGWITGVEGLTWGDQVKAAGNGVVPQQAAAALRDMLAAFDKQHAA
jgi:DNA (cytosine-5)-methyltransferase 1